VTSGEWSPHPGMPVGEGGELRCALVTGCGWPGETTGSTPAPTALDSGMAVLEARCMSDEEHASPPNDEGSLLGLALQRWNAGDYAAAVALLEEAHTRCPDSSTILYHLGRSHARLGSTDRATDYYLAAVAHDPGMVKAHVNLALLYMRRRRLAPAEHHLLEACKHDPECAEAHLNLGALYAEQGKTNDGIRHLEKAAELLPHDAEACFNLGLAYRAHGLPHKAVRALKKAVQLRPNDPGLLFHLAESLHHAGRVDEAMATCRTVIEMAPDQPDAYMLLGRLYDRKGMKPDAKGWYDRYWALKGHPIPRRQARTDNPEV
jgi:protein O-GlcNAc transferase